MEEQNVPQEIATKHPTNNESFVSWQTITITQLGYAANLILSFATATLGFSLLLVKDWQFTPASWGKGFFLLSLISIMASIGLGVWCVLNRLHDFKKTKDIARDREYWQRDGKGQVEINSRLQARRTKTNCFEYMR